MATVGQPVEECGGHLGVAEDGGPFAEAEVCGDDDAGALVKLAEEMEEQRTAGGAERQVAQLVEVDEGQKTIRGIVFTRRANRASSGFRRSARLCPWSSLAPGR